MDCLCLAVATGIDAGALDEAGQAHLLQRLEEANAKLQRHIDSLKHHSTLSTAQQRPEVHSSRLSRVGLRMLHLCEFG